MKCVRAQHGVGARQLTTHGEIALRAAVPEVAAGVVAAGVRATVLSAGTRLKTGFVSAVPESAVRESAVPESAVAKSALPESRPMCPNG